MFHIQHIFTILLGLGSVGFLLGGGELLGLPVNLPAIGEEGNLNCGPLHEFRIKDTGATFKVRSTSTLSDIRYDPDTKQIVVHASGDDGKKGTLCVEVPKDLLGDKILVDVDDPDAKYSVVDKLDSRIVKI